MREGAVYRTGFGKIFSWRGRSPLGLRHRDRAERAVSARTGFYPRVSINSCDKDASGAGVSKDRRTGSASSRLFISDGVRCRWGSRADSASSVLACGETSNSLLACPLPLLPRLREPSGAAAFASSRFFNLA
jgi:hypothetical protein